MPERVRKPEWLKISIGANERYTETKRIVESHCLHTICSSGRCPNMGECWGKGTATFMIGGNICTRCCKFCNTASGKPLPLDADEPTHVAESIALMKLSHAVVTSVDRDDLPDLGASHWVRTIREIKRLNPDTTVEVLIPDFQGRKELVAQVIDAQPEIISHNMETVRRISPLVRSAAKYETSLEVLRQIAESNTTTKSGIMVGLGETPEEVEELMDDLRRVGLPHTDHRAIPSTHTQTLSGSSIYYSQTICTLQRERIGKRVSASGKRSIGTLLLSCGKTDPFYTKKK